MSMGRALLCCALLIVCAGQMCSFPSDATVDTDGGFAPEPEPPIGDEPDTDDEVVEGDFPPPELVIVAPSSVTEGDLIVLDASQSFTPRQAELSFRWEQTSGPAVSLGNATSATVSFTAPEVDQDTTLRFNITIDDTVESATATVNVLVGDSIASAGVELAIVEEIGEGPNSMTVHFVGTTTSGDPLPTGTYTWDFGDGETAGGTDVTHTYSTARVYQVVFCVSVNGTLSGCTAKDIEITATEPLPVGGGAGGGGVVGGGEMSVSTGDFTIIEGDDGYSSTSKSYTVTNIGSESITWNVNYSKQWISLGKAGGTLDGGATDTLVVTLNANADSLDGGIHEDTLQFRNASNGKGNSDRGVKLTKRYPGKLEVTPTEDFTSAGPAGGPFNPISKSYLVRNTGQKDLNWSVGKNSSWITLSTSGGTLSAGQSVTVTASFNSNANALAAGAHSDTLSFTNNGNAGR